MPLLPVLQDGLAGLDDPELTRLARALGGHEGTVDLLRRAILDQPPPVIREGGVLAPGYDAELDELRDLSQHADQFLLELEQRERARSGIDTLKVSYNRVHGYYIEVGRSKAAQVPDDYIRRQTLKGVERYITPELKAFEDKVLSARERALQREKALYEALLERLLEPLPALQASAEAVARIDVLACFAERAERLDLCRPGFRDAPGLAISAGRHPVVEQVSEGPFVANDLVLDEQRNILIVTGPNRGGKSTFMRQAALIVLMAYAGSYVPAQRAALGPFDRVFSRIGASDDLAGGRSTFMVEMTETAVILNNATDASLVLMDEIGRGTSTYDGLSLAWACASHIARRVRAFTLFATHYFELTSLAGEIDAVENVHLDATEHGDELVFLHAVKPGPASRSYGLQVAQLAGVPKEVIASARRYLAALEKGTFLFSQFPAEGRASAKDAVPDAGMRAPMPLQLDLTPATRPHEALELLAETDPDRLTPREALQLLYDLKSKL